MTNLKMEITVTQEDLTQLAHIHLIKDSLSNFIVLLMEYGADEKSIELLSQLNNVSKAVDRISKEYSLNIKTEIKGALSRKEDF